MKSITILMGIYLFSMSQEILGNNLHSQSRPENKSALEMRESYFKSLQINKSDIEKTSISIDASVSLNELDYTNIPEWESLEQIQAAFIQVRDARFIEWRHYDTQDDYQRRSSWLYPDDGCFARAELAKYNMKEWDFPDVKKIFIFGNLKVDSVNHPDGYVTWWYHVVPVVRFTDQVYVLDPAINPSQPLLVEQWSERMNGDGSLESFTYQICSEDSYVPYNNCENPTKTPLSLVKLNQNTYLDYEWDRLERLSRDPIDELGDLPPWMEVVK